MITLSFLPSSTPLCPSLPPFLTMISSTFSWHTSFPSGKWFYASCFLMHASSFWREMADRGFTWQSETASLKNWQFLCVDFSHKQKSCALVEMVSMLSLKNLLSGEKIYWENQSAGAKELTGKKTLTFRTWGDSFKIWQTRVVPSKQCLLLHDFYCFSGSLKINKFYLLWLMAAKEKASWNKLEVLSLSSLFIPLSVILQQLVIQKWEFL